MATKAEAGSTAFVVIGIVFIVLGATTELGFLGAGIAFLVLGLGGLGYSRSKKGGDGGGSATQP